MDLAGEPEKHEQGPIDASEITARKGADALAEPVAGHCHDLVDHDVARVEQSICAAWLDRFAQALRVRLVRRDQADRNGSGMPIIVGLNDQGRAGLAGNSRSP